MANNTSLGPTTYRLEALTDGIFAIAMTILVLNLTIPHIAKQAAHTDLLGMLTVQTNDLFCYGLSFLLLAKFWMLHHKQFHYFKRTNSTHLWINILILMFITLIPFTSSLIALYPDLQYTNIFFHSNLFIVGALFYFDWTYATYKHRLSDPGLPKKVIWREKALCLMTPFVALCAMAFTFISPAWSPILYLATPLISVRISKK